MKKQGDREVLFELYSVGTYTKCTAVCPHTGVEVSIVGPTEMSERVLMNNARRKLEYVLDRDHPTGAQRGTIA